MKIGFFTDSYLPTPDGVATSVESSAKELQKLGHEVYIIAANQPHKKDRKTIYRLVSVRVVKAPDIWWALEVPQPALFKIAKLELDIIHGHSGGPISFLGWQLAQLHDIPFVETYHTLWKYYRHYLLYPKLVKHWMIRKMTSFFSNDCDAMIVPSVKAKNELLKSRVKKPIYVVPNGIYTEKFKHLEKGYLHSKYDIPDNKKIMLTVGRLHKEKSIDFLITAFALVKKSIPNAVFVIIGNGQKKIELQQLAASLGVTNDIYFVGGIDFADMPKAYTDSDLFLFASQTETQGMVILEALAAGVPVVAVADQAFENTVENGVNGFLVKKAPEEFAEKIKTILSDGVLHNKLRNDANKSAEAFSIGYTTRILEQIYQEVLYQNELEKNDKNLKSKRFNGQMLSLMGMSQQLSHEYKNLKDMIDHLKQ